MKTLAIIFAVLVSSRAAPQGYGSGGGGVGGGGVGGGGVGGGGAIRFTQKEYNGLQQALGSRVPVAIYSGNQVFSMVEEYPSDFVVLNLPGLGFGSASGGGGYSSPSGLSIAHARTGAVAAGDDLAEAFRELSQDAVEEVQDAAEDSVNRILSVDEGPAASPAVELPAAPLETAVRSAVAAPVSEALDAPVEAISAAALETPVTPEAAAAPLEVAQAAAPEAPAAPPAAETAALPQGTPAPPAAAGFAAGAEEAASALQDVAVSPAFSRRKRQDDDDQSAIDELSFAFAGLGGLVGSNLGRYFDATYSANLDLLHGLENVGLLVLDQVDERLERRRKLIEERRRKNSQNST